MPLIPTFLFRTKCDSQLKGLLVAELQNRMTPLLEDMAFRAFRPRKGGFATNYYRRSKNQIDVIQFQWDRRGTPAFVINFDVIDDLVKFTTVAGDASEAWFNVPKYRASTATGMVERWFHIGYFSRIFSARTAAEREVSKALVRVEEIDRFAKTGETSLYFRSMTDSSPVLRRKDSGDSA